MAGTGTLDLDDQGGGRLVENVYFTAPASGQYEFWAHNYDGMTTTNYTIDVVTPTMSMTHSGSLPAASVDGQHFMFVRP